jgi:beta-N-acetylhexosaminidase
MGAAVIDGLQSRGIMAVAKHFPGIGRTVLDSHIDRPCLNVDRAALESTDLLPFRAAIQMRVSGIMLAHIVYDCLDPDWPASLSERTVKDLLRRRLGYEGVVYTDDLEMGAITRHYDFETTLQRVVDADIDMALICHSAEKQARAFAFLRDLIDGSEQIRQQARISAGRILALKAAYLGSRSAT